MYQLLLSNAHQNTQSVQSTVDAFFTMLGMSVVLTFLLPILTFIFVLIIKILLGVLTQSIAGKKGYNRFGFFWYGFFFFPIAVGVAILAPPLNSTIAAKTMIPKEDNELDKYTAMYNAGTISWTQYCQKKEEIETKQYYK